MSQDRHFPIFATRASSQGNNSSNSQQYPVTFSQPQIQSFCSQQRDETCYPLAAASAFPPAKSNKQQNMFPIHHQHASNNNASSRMHTSWKPHLMATRPCSAPHPNSHLWQQQQRGPGLTPRSFSAAPDAGKPPVISSSCHPQKTASPLYSFQPSYFGHRSQETPVLPMSLSQELAERKRAAGYAGPILSTDARHRQPSEHPLSSHHPLVQSLPSPEDLLQSTQLTLETPMNAHDILLNKIELLRQEVTNVTGPFAGFEGKIQENKVQTEQVLTTCGSISDSVGSMLQLLENQKSQFEHIATFISCINERPPSSSLSHIFREQATQTSPAPLGSMKKQLCISRGGAMPHEALDLRVNINQALSMSNCNTENNRGGCEVAVSLDEVPFKVMPVTILRAEDTQNRSTSANSRGFRSNQVVVHAVKYTEGSQGETVLSQSDTICTEASKCPCPKQPTSLSVERASHITKGSSSRSCSVITTKCQQEADVVPWIKKSSNDRQQQHTAKYVAPIANITPKANKLIRRSSTINTQARDINPSKRLSNDSTLDEPAATMNESSNVRCVGRLSLSPSKDPAFNTKIRGELCRMPCDNGTYQNFSLFEPLLSNPCSQSSKCKRSRETTPTINALCSIQKSFEEDDIARRIAIKIKRHRAKQLSQKS
ncbi:hypothetical protein CEUSTIGMA_g1255.t1 [Chlamydomonas eustigma]|uniref:Uncharacterized protein n=1 Tax=Chlamydomonas eustigma TaxID=1157962 RepID=A0A250WSJ1_9CHLO|nr:hypothetical protein CEUSTIGMA_g1255.t1 [Chlamydomonas eustigma]|eukprot:GAX73804.1 hypothetical protein CEUSTIGMA_g1255.t1 [Chlamydomonas eustigma]